MSREDIIRYWLEKARDDLASAKTNSQEERFQNAVRDAYFACFHALTAVLLQDWKHFKKHREIRR
jgi:uncharacterized protein (UPF0332 family)